MAKLLKIGYKTVSIVLELALLCFIVISFGIRFPAFQTFLAHQASNWLSKELKTVVRIDKVDIAFFDHVYISGVYLEDLDRDTLAYLGEIELNIKTFNWSFDEIAIDQLALSDGKINLIKKLGQAEFNYVFIEDYFASDQPKKPKTGKGPKIHLSNFILNDIDFKYILEYRKDYQYGINFNKLDLRKVNLFIENLTIEDERFIGKIAAMSAQEKSGFVLDKFSADFDLSATLLNIKDGRIETERSDIQITELTFLTKTWDNYNYFEDSVFMDIRLSKTIASMTDVAYFAEDLWGMDQEVFLSGRAQQYVYNLKIKDLYLETGRETLLRGNFELPDFRLSDYPIPLQQIAYLQTSYRDLEKFKLPLSKAGLETYIDFPRDIHTQRILREAGLVQISKIALQGHPKRFSLAVDEIKSGLGTISAREGIAFHEDNQGVLNYQPLGQGLALTDVDLEKISGESTLGFTSGLVNFQGRGISDRDLTFEQVTGTFDYIDLNNRRFKDFRVKNAQVTTSEFNGKLFLQDPSVKLIFEGKISYDEREEIEGLVNIEHVDFEKIGVSALEGLYATGDISVKLKGFNINEIRGSAQLDGLTLNNDSTSYTFNELAVMLDRSGLYHALIIESDVVNGRIDGDLDFDQIVKAAQSELSQILPLFIPELEDQDFVYKDFANFQFTVSDVNSLLYVIEPLLTIERGTKLQGTFNGRIDKYDFELISPQIKYADKVLTGIKMLNKIDSSGIEANYTVNRFNYNDSLFYNNITFTSSGTNAAFLSKLTWGEAEFQGGELNWLTTVNAKNDIKVEMNDCHFFIESERWGLENFDELGIKPKVFFRDNAFEIHDFMFISDLQYVSIDGKISNQIEDALEIRISDFDIDLFNKLFVNDFILSGYISGNIALHNVLSDILVEGTASIDDLSLNDNYIGTIDFESSYDDVKNKIKLSGELFNPTISKTKTNKFYGDYTFAKTLNGIAIPDQMDFVFNFATMDISFANAFVDEEVASNIQGILEGDLFIKGSSLKPLISGQLDLNNAKAKIGLLGTTYGIQGPINITNYGLSIVNMPILDQENNAALLSATVFHDNFRKWDYNVFLDLTRDGIKKDPQNKNIPARLERFLALNTEFTEGDVFYGRGYVTGNVNIYGTTDLVEITANVTSARGTQINFPMFGRGEIKEDDFVIFINNTDSSQITLDNKIDFTGVRLNLNIQATPDAQLRIIFDDRTGDEIAATGRGRFRITLDELNDVTMTGTFEVDEGEYNFALGVVKKLFKIEPGSTVKWMGDPYEATLNVRTYYLVEANIQDISALYDREAELRTNARDQIYCYLSLKDRLSQPVLEFDIEAPRASDAGRIAINRVRADEDELTRQFFSLLLMRQFQPIRGSQAAANTRGSNALNELLANQINAVLGQISGNYDLRVRMNDDELANQSTYELGFASAFLDDRLLVSGSFGVSQMRNGAAGQGTNPLIGDVNIEYKLNRSGTFRVNVFNRSNQFTVIQQHNLGLFTQGVGIYYQESFSGWHDFQLAQYTLDIFRPYNQRRFMRLDSRLMPLPPLTPPDTTKTAAPKPEEETSPEKNEEVETGDSDMPLTQRNPVSQAIRENEN